MRFSSRPHHMSSSWVLTVLSIWDTADSYSKYDPMIRSTADVFRPCDSCLNCHLAYCYKQPRQFVQIQIRMENFCCCWHFKYLAILKGILFIIIHIFASSLWGMLVNIQSEISREAPACLHLRELLSWSALNITDIAYDVHRKWFSAKVHNEGVIIVQHHCNTEQQQEADCHICVGQRRSMFIQMHPTPNPASMMFMPGKTVMEV